jgi:hypothetical protein
VKACPEDHGATADDGVVRSEADRGQVVDLTAEMTRNASFAAVSAKLIVSTNAADESTQDTLVVVGDFDRREPKRLDAVLLAITKNGGLNGFSLKFEVLPEQKPEVV